MTVPSIRRMLGSLFAAGLICAVPFQGEAVLVTAKGKDASTAALNAKVSAVRTAMQQMTDAEFLKKNMPAVRSAIILKAADFSPRAAITETKQDGGLTVITADVDIDLDALRAALRKLGAPVLEPVQKNPVAVAEEDSPDEDMKKLSEAYLASLRELFGDSVRLRPKSDALPLSDVKPVTESLAIGAKVTHAPQTVKSGESFWVRWDTPDASQNSGRMVLCRSDMPLGSLNETKNSLIADWNLEGSQGLLYVTAPVSQGHYELRLYPTRDKDASCAARAGFTVAIAPESIPMLGCTRSIFIPEEQMHVELRNRNAFLDGVAFIAKAVEMPVIQKRDLSIVGNTKHFADHRDTHIEINAPREPGKYAFYIFPEDRDTAIAFAVLPFEVRLPNDPGKAMLAVQPDVLSSERPRFFVRSAPDWQWEKLEWQIRPKGECKDWSRDYINASSMDLNKVNLSSHNALARYYEPGEFTVYVFNQDPRKEGAKPVMQADFKVKPAPLSAAVNPALIVEPQEIAPGDSISVRYAARQEWPDSKNNASWIGLVPKGTPPDAPTAFKLAEKSRYNTSRRMADSYEFNVDELPGEYELRMYDGSDEKAKIQVSVPVTVMTEDRVKAMDAAAEKAVEDYLNEPEPSPVWMNDEMLRRQFRVPQIRFSGSDNSGPSLAGASQKTVVSKEISLLLASAPAERYRMCGGPIVSDAIPDTLVALARDNRCDKYIDEEVQKMRLLDVTLGRDNQLKDALWDAATAIATKFPFKGDKMKKMQTLVNVAVDTYSHGTAGIDAYESGDYLGAAQNAMAMLLKGAVNLCDDEDCFEKVRSFSDGMLKDYVQKCSPSEYKALLEKASRELGDKAGMLKKIENLRTGSDYALNVDAGTAASQGWDSGDYAEMLWTLGEGAITTAWPPSAVIIAAAKVTKQGALAARDFIVDDSTQTLYKAYKEHMDGGAGQEDFVSAFSARNNWYSLVKARNVMIGNLHKPEVLKSLSKENLARAKAGLLTADDLDQSEIWGFLHKQFDAWVKAEKHNDSFASYANSLRDDYKNMECDAWFNDMRTKEKKGVSDRITGSISNWWHDYCPDEVARFKDYVKARADIEAELTRWGWGSSRDCSSAGSLREESRDLLCKLARGGENAYLDGAVELAKYCGWKLGDDKLGKHAKEAALLRREATVAKTLTQIGRTDILNCLCCAAGRTAYGVMCGYDPQAHPDASPSCGHTNPPCLGGNWGCFRYPMNTSKKALENCGAYEALRQYKAAHAQVKR
ncbi:MAG: hypothetical protein J6I40_02865 [Mailhella sp.]|nr:hypothetical protein [Mailhella sp.]